MPHPPPQATTTDPTTPRTEPLRNGNPRGDPNSAPRCGAHTRAGCPCRAPAISGKLRCRMHGGRSTGPRTAEGLARLRAARTTHGGYGAEARAFHRHTLTLLRRGRLLCQAVHYQAWLPAELQLRLYCMPAELMPPRYHPQTDDETRCTVMRGRAAEQAVMQAEAASLAPWKAAITHAKAILRGDTPPARVAAAISPIATTTHAAAHPAGPDAPWQTGSQAAPLPLPQAIGPAPARSEPVAPWQPPPSAGAAASGGAGDAGALLSIATTPPGTGPVPRSPAAPPLEHAGADASWQPPASAPPPRLGDVDDAGTGMPIATQHPGTDPAPAAAPPPGHAEAIAPWPPAAPDRSAASHGAGHAGARAPTASSPRSAGPAPSPAAPLAVGAKLHAPCQPPTPTPPATGTEAQAPRSPAAPPTGAAARPQRPATGKSRTQPDAPWQRPSRGQFELRHRLLTGTTAGGLLSPFGAFGSLGHATASSHPPLGHPLLGHPPLSHPPLLPLPASHGTVPAAKTSA